MVPKGADVQAFQDRVENGRIIVEIFIQRSTTSRAILQPKQKGLMEGGFGGWKCAETKDG